MMLLMFIDYAERDLDNMLWATGSEIISCRFCMTISKSTMQSDQKVLSFSSVITITKTLKHNLKDE